MTTIDQWRRPITHIIIKSVSKKSALSPDPHNTMKRSNKQTNNKEKEHKTCCRRFLCVHADGARDKRRKEEKGKKKKKGGGKEGRRLTHGKAHAGMHHRRRIRWCISRTHTGSPQEHRGDLGGPEGLF
jgi:hypothetical protein